LKKTKTFEQIKILLAFFALIISFSYVKESLKLAIFLIFSLVFIIFSILYAKSKEFDSLNEVMKFFLCFLNLTSLVYFIEKLTKTSYFDSVNKIIYEPLFEKGINTSIFLLAIFVASTILLVVISRLSLGEDYGEERQ
jgi:hypothetical protein